MDQGRAARKDARLDEDLGAVMRKPRKRQPSKAAPTRGHTTEIVALGRKIIADRGGLAMGNKALTIEPLASVKAALTRRA